MEISIPNIVKFNIRFYAKQKGIKIGDIEKELSLSQGYLSRGTNDISIVKVYKASKLLDVSIDDLCTLDNDEGVNELIYKILTSFKQNKSDDIIFELILNNIKNNSFRDYIKEMEDK